METLHQPNEIIGECYRLATLIDEGAFGTTYEAEDLTNYRRVAIKALSLQHRTDSKVLELFEREANVLASLNHPAIPKYFDYFRAETPTNDRFYLVRELIDGESLADLVKKGWHPNEQEIKRIAIQILECLEYLHSLESSVIHRDIKPENIIRCRNGKVFLVNFGTVQEVYRHTFADRSTFVGTVGYIPPEQYNSQVKPATDIYALGATLLFLLTHKSPDGFPQHRLKIEFRDWVNLSPELANILEKMLEPFIEERFQSATAVLEVLKGERQKNNYPSFKHQPPSRNPVRLNKTNKHLIAEIPSAGWASGLQGWVQLGLLISSLIFGGLTLRLLVIQSENLQTLDALVNSLLTLTMSLICLGILLLSMKESNRLEINERTFNIQCKLLGFNSEQVQGKTRNIRRVEITPAEFVVVTIEACALVERTGVHKFGMMLEAEQKQWLIEEISEFLTQLQPTISQTDSPEVKLTKPRGSRLGLKKKGDRLIIDIPPALSTVFRWYYLCISFSTILGISVSSSQNIQHLLVLLKNKDINEFPLTEIVPGLSLTFVWGTSFWGIFFEMFLGLSFLLAIATAIAYAIYEIFGLRVHLEIDRQTFIINWRNFLGSRRQVRGKVADLQDVFVANIHTTSSNQDRDNIKGCILAEGIQKHCFGSRLSRKEQRWLVEELVEFLGFDKLID